MIGKHMVAVCDILGFKELVMKNNLEFVIKQCMGYFRKALYHSMHQEGPLSDLPTLEELKKQNRVGFAWFSDTVLFYSLGDSVEDYKYVVQTVAWLVFYNIFYHPTSIRAGISYGDAFIDETDGIYIGQAIVEAHELQCQQNWSGGALTTSAEHLIPPEATNRNISDWFLIPYEVPLKTDKGNSSKAMVAIDWTRGIHDYLSFSWSDSSEEPTEEDKIKRPDVVSKWRNTKHFHENVCTMCKK